LLITEVVGGKGNIHVERIESGCHSPPIVPAVMPFQVEGPGSVTLHSNWVGFPRRADLD